MNYHTLSLWQIINMSQMMFTWELGICNHARIVLGHSWHVDGSVLARRSNIFITPFKSVYWLFLFFIIIVFILVHHVSLLLHICFMLFLCWTTASPTAPGASDSGSASDSPSFQVRTLGSSLVKHPTIGVPHLMEITRVKALMNDWAYETIHMVVEW